MKLSKMRNDAVTHVTDYKTKIFLKSVIEEEITN